MAIQLKSTADEASGWLEPVCDMEGINVTDADHIFYWWELSFECIETLSRLPEQPFEAGGFKILSIDDDGVMEVASILHPVFIDERGEADSVLNLIGVVQRYLENRDLAYVSNLNQALPGAFAGMSYAEVDTALLLFLVNEAGFDKQGFLSRNFVFEYAIEFLDSYILIDGEVKEGIVMDKAIDTLVDTVNNRIRILEWVAG